MNISITGKNLEITPYLRKHIQKRIELLEKYIHPLTADLVLDRDAHHHAGLVFRAEVNLSAGGKMMHGETRAADAYEAVDLLIPKLKEQISKFKNKKRTRTFHAPTKLKALDAGISA